MAENIRVACRVRPLNDSEIAKQSASVLTFPGDGKTAVSISGRTFVFDHVVQPQATQLDVYELIAKPVVSSVLNGYNGTIFAYGQTSSGKTFTMEGVLNDPVYQGIIPRIIHDIFNHIYQMDENLEFHIKVSYYEIYMEKVRDLLDVTKTNLSVHEDKDHVPYVKGATERFVSNPEEVFDVIDEGKSNRHVSVTNMNEHSSRSHSVFMVTVRQENMETQKKLHGKLYLVDLAGSEKVGKTGAEGTVLDEAKNINKSLSSLGNVINALVEGSPHVPYRDSKLTRILQESLGGNARTTMIICCSPAAFNESETKSTLLFGMRAKTIKNCVQVNEELTAEEWRRRYEREKERNRRLRIIIAGLEAELARWRNGEKVEKTDWFSSDKVDESALVEEDTTTAAAAAGGLATSGPGGSAPGGPPSQLSGSAAATPGASSTAGTPAASQPSGGSTSASLRASNVGLEELYRQLDDKDEEINQSSQTISQMQQQVEELEELIRQLRGDAERYQQDLSHQQAMNEASKEEVKEVLQALEELAVNYDSKAQELEAKSRELEEMQEKMSEQKGHVSSRESELHHWKEVSGQQKRRYTEMVIQLARDLHEVAETVAVSVGPDVDPSTATNTPASTTTNTGTAGGVAAWSGVTFQASGDKLEEEFTLMRLHSSKLKAEAKSLVARQKQLEEERQAQQVQLRQSADQLKETHIRMSEFERKVDHQTARLEELEAGRRRAAEDNDRLRNELTSLKTASIEARDHEILRGQDDIRQRLDEEFQRRNDEYAAQLARLRDDLNAKEHALEEAGDRGQHLSLQLEQIRGEHAKLTEEHDAKARRLEELERQMQRSEQTRADLKGLEDTVFKELQTLHNLRRLFVQDMRNRIKKSAQIREQRQLRQQAAQQAENGGGEPNNTGGVAAASDPGLNSEDEANDNGDSGAGLFRSGSIAQKQKITFLENNLEQLTKVHKQLVKDNAELRCEVPKLEKRLKTVMDRVKTLEDSLKEAKDTAVRDRRRYQSEVERIKEHVRARNVRRTNAPNIVKPIRAGQGAPPQSAAALSMMAPQQQPLSVVGIHPGTTAAP